MIASGIAQTFFFALGGSGQECPLVLEELVRIPSDMNGNVIFKKESPM